MGSLPNTSVLKGPTAPRIPQLIHKLFEKCAEQNKNEIALIFEDSNEINHTSFDELNRESNKLARTISATILKQKIPANSDGDFIIAVSMHPTQKLINILLAILKTGAAYLPIDPSFPPGRIEHILNEAKPVLVVYDKDFEFPHQVCSKTYDELTNESKNVSEGPVEDSETLKHDKDNLAIVLYTSGSTGVPKGVRLSHDVILNRLFWQFTKFPYSSHEKVGIFKTALTFVDSVSEIWGPLLNARTVLVVQKKITQDPEKLINLLEKYKIERLVLVPSLLRSLLLYLNLKKNEKLLKNLKTFVCSGEPLVNSLAQEFFKYFPEEEHILCNFYGSTEVMGDVTYHVIYGLRQLQKQEKVPIGLPIDNTIIYLLDEAMKPVEDGTIGELWVSGLNLAAGYVKGRDSDKFITNPHFGRLYRTGDYAKVSKGTILYEGRIDSQIKIRGHRVDLSEVEKAVLSLDNIDKGIVLCYRPGEINQALLAFVTLKKGSFVNECHIENWLQIKLAAYMIPQVIILENVPLLVNGKIDRQALLKKYETSNNNCDKTTLHNELDFSNFSKHQLTAAKILLQTVASVLNHSARGAISINSNFYDIGGNSLNSILTISKLNEQGYFISIGDFINAKDFKEVLNYMSPDKHILPIKSEVTKYYFEMLTHNDKSVVFEMITDTFYEKGDLERWLKPEMHKEHYVDLLEQMWGAFLAQSLSFIVKTEAGKTMGVALNIDAHDEPKVKIKTSLSIIEHFLLDLESPARKVQLPKGKGKIIYSSMMATNPSLTPQENVSVMQYMEQEILKIARNKNFVGILTTNTSPLTQQLGLNVYGYETLADVQVNQYVAPDGTKPFGRAPDDQRVIVSWKSV